MTISDRLHRTKIHKGVEQRRKELERKREEDFRKSCTFKPTLEKSSVDSLTTSTASSRIGSIGSGRHRSLKASRSMKQAKSDAMRDCTFKPKVNRVSKKMVAAKTYLEMNCFERLSRPVVKLYLTFSKYKKNSLQGCLWRQ